jgi:hypothetical protein
MELALSGLTGSKFFTTINGTGYDLSEYGYKPLGAGYHRSYRIIFA